MDRVIFYLISRITIEVFMIDKMDLWTLPEMWKTQFSIGTCFPEKRWKVLIGLRYTKSGMGSVEQSEKEPVVPLGGDQSSGQSEIIVFILFSCY